LVDEIENEITKKQFYQKLCDLALYGSNKEFFDTVKILAKLGTVEAVEVLLKILLHHPKGKHCDECDLPRSAAVTPLIRMWKFAPEKIIPLIPIFCKYNVNDDHIEENLPEMFDEIGKETLQKAFISGLNDYDSLVRFGTLYSLHDHEIMKNNLLLLIDAYKIETNIPVQNNIESILLENINEEIAEMFFELIKNYRIDLNKSIIENEFYPEDEMTEKIIPIFLRKWKKEKDGTIRGLIHDVVETLVNSFKEDIHEVFSKDEVKQLQEMGILEK